MKSSNEITIQQSNYLKFIAIILITNSHLDSYYPYSQLGTGGSLGNSIFFLFSGYGLAKSLNKDNITWGIWIIKRLLRIYPSTIIVTIISIFLFTFITWPANAIDFIKLFIWPTQFWFISAILFFYILYYPIFRWGKIKAVNAIIFISAGIYFYLYFTTMDINYFSIEKIPYFKWLYYFIVMLLGSFLSQSKLKLIPTKKVFNSIAIFVSFCTYFGFLFTLSKGYCLDFQFLAHILNLWLIYHLINLATTIEINNQFILKPINLIAGLTLEIYLLQFAIYSNEWIKNLIFPLNLFVFATILILSAFVINKVSVLLISFINRKNVINKI